MAVTIEQVRAALEPEELDYNRVAKELGPDALPHLERLIVSDHPMLASKAAYLAGMIGTTGSVTALERAARSADARVRIAAAAAVKNLPPEPASDVLLNLIDDPDIGVQKVAVKSVPAQPSAVLQARVEGLSRGKAGSVIRDLAQEVLAARAGYADASASGQRKKTRKKKRRGG